VIAPPRWLADRRPVTLTPRVTARIGGLGWRTDPYED
jgi:hypothetical protein